MTIEAMRIIGIGLAAALLWFMFFEYLQFRVDELRQRLFTLRERLFMQAAEGKLEFGSTAYGMTRITLNGVIRFAHELNLLRIISILVVAKIYTPDMGREYRQRLSAAIEEMPSHEARKIIHNVREQMHLELARFLLLTSPTFFCFGILALLNNLTNVAGKGLRASVRETVLTKEQVYRTKVARLDAEAYGIGYVVANESRQSCPTSA